MLIKYKILFSMLFYSSVVFGQQSLEQLVDLRLRDVSIEEVIEEISQKTDLKFSYSKNLFPSKKMALFVKRQTSVKKVLDDLLLERRLQYKYVGNQIVIFKSNLPLPPEKFTISGYIEDSETGERLIGATLFELNSQKGTYSNRYGFFSMTLSSDSPKIYINYLGYKTYFFQKEKRVSEFIIFKLKPNVILGEEIIVSSRLRQKEDLRSPEIDMSQMNLMPGMLGETDLLRTINTLPGVQSGAEGIGGLHVRGGNFDQNLILLDDAPIYNPIHAWGVYSIFNSSAIQRTRLYKSGFPSRYGGRLSSVIDVQTKDGNKHKREHEIEAGLISAKASTEGPLIKNKSSYFFSVRRSLTDLVDILPYDTIFDDRDDAINPELNYYFYDVNLKLNYSPDNKNRFHLSFYRGQDVFWDHFGYEDNFRDTTVFFQSDVSQNWGNQIATIRWNRTLSEKLFSNVTATFSRYDYKSRTKRINLTKEYDLTASALSGYNSNIEDKSIKIDLDYYNSPGNTTRFGGRVSEYLFQPGVYNESTSLGDSVDPDSLQLVLDTLWQSAEMRPQEISVYAEREMEFLKKVNMTLGFNSSVFFSDGSIRFSFDPRIKFSWTHNKNLSIGFDGQRITQFTHLISPNRFGLPNDIWVSSTDLVEPQTALQFSGWAHGKIGKSKMGVELYWKNMDHLNEFSPKRTSVLNATDWENEIVSGDGEAYGVEFEASRDFRLINASVNYTYAFSNRNFEGINNNQSFRFRYDRRHSINASFFKKINKKWNISSSFVFATELATTLPRGRYTFPDFGFPLEIVVIGDRNEDVIPPFHHLDIGADYSWKSSRIKFGIHNVYFRKNILLYEFGKDSETESPLKQRVMPPFLPAISYNIKLK